MALFTATGMLPHLKWIIPVLLTALVAVVAVFWLRREVLRRRHDKELLDEMRADAAREAPSALTAQVTVVPQEVLPNEGKHIFMPVPTFLSDLVDFVNEARDKVAIRSCVRKEDADRMMSDVDAEHLKFTMFRKMEKSDSCAYVTLEALSSDFSPYSYVNLEILKAHELAAPEATSLSIVAEGVLRKPLMIEANEFSVTAVKMISLTGGRAVLVARGTND